MPRAALTAKQRACAHPYREIVPCVDPRWERCQLCGLIRVAPLPAPWIVAHDEAQPIAPPPPLFEMQAQRSKPRTRGPASEPFRGGPQLVEPVSVPVVAVPAEVRGPVEVLTPTRERAQTIRERDDGLLGLDFERWEGPDLEESDAEECRRCGGQGSRREAIRSEEGGKLVYARRKCTRCGGTGRTCQYSA